MSATTTARTLDLRAIVAVPEARRFDTFGGEPIHLRPVWSPEDLGLGGTCSVPDTWLECGLEDWIIQPAEGRWDGPTLGIFFAPGVRERLGRDLRPGEGPLDIVGHFGDPAARSCRPGNRDTCQGRFVVTAIEAGD